MFNKIKIYGNSDINYIWSKKKAFCSDEYISEIEDKGVYSPVWDVSTVMLANFKEDVSAGTFEQTNEIVGYKISKKEVGESKFTVVDYMSHYENILEDYNVKNGVEYIYSVTPIYNIEDKEVFGETVLSDTIIPDSDRFMIIGLIPTDDTNKYRIDEDNIWSFFLNAEEGDFSIRNNKQYTDGFRRFPKGYSGETDYLETTFKSYLGGIVCSSMKYGYDDIAKIEKWRAFCNSDCLKLFKDIKGHVIPCDIATSNYSVDNSLDGIPTTINISIKEMRDYKDISVCEVKEDVLL